MKRNAVATVCALAAVFLSVNEPNMQESADAIVRRIYRDFPAHGRDLLKQPRERLSLYFDDALTDLILADRACAAKFQAICRLDFSPIWASQDPVGATPPISQTSDATVVAVKLQWAELLYHMVETPTGWRIHDIEYGDGASLVAILTREIR